MKKSLHIISFDEVGRKKFLGNKLFEVRVKDDEPKANPAQYVPSTGLLWVKLSRRKRLCVEIADRAYGNELMRAANHLWLLSRFSGQPSTVYLSSSRIGKVIVLNKGKEKRILG